MFFSDYQQLGVRFLDFYIFYLNVSSFVSISTDDCEEDITTIYSPPVNLEY